jgi:protein-tyrosine kinase
MSAHENIVTIPSSRMTARAAGDIGSILVKEGVLSAPEAERVAEQQQRLGLRFGETAVRMNLVTESEVHRALSQQFDHHLLDPQTKGLSEEIYSAHDPEGPRTETLRGLRSQLMIRWLGSPSQRRTLAIVSARHGEGRSHLTANLGVAFAQLGCRTLIIDADLRAPRQHALFNLPDRVGLSSILAGRTDRRGAAMPAGIAGLHVLPAGAVPPNPQELLSRPQFGALLDDVRAHYDVVLIDTSPANAYADAQGIAYQCGHALMVVRRDETRVEEATEALRSFVDSGILVVGSVMTAFRSERA